MKISTSILFLILLAALPLTVAAAEPEVIYWNSDAGKALRARIAPDADYWQLIPWGPATGFTQCTSLVVLFGELIKFMFRQEFKQLRKNRIMMCHGLNPLCFTVFGGTSIVNSFGNSGHFYLLLMGQQWVRLH